jgi:AraC-like DNA-binding protein
MLLRLKNNNKFYKALSYGGSLVPMNARISVVGHENQCKKSYDWHGLKRGEKEFLLWQYTISGRGQLQYEDRSYSLETQDAMLLNIPHNHRYYLPENSDHWEFIFIIMRGSECMRLGKKLIDLNGPVFHYEKRSPIFDCIETIFNEIMDDQPDQYRLSSLAYSFCMTHLSEIGSKVPSQKRPDSIQQAVKFALNHFTEPIGVEDMAEAADLSRYHFSREFKKYLQASPADFIHKLRMEKALNMIQSGHSTIQNIADECGFQSASYFCRAFLKDFGISPGKYRATR